MSFSIEKISEKASNFGNSFHNQFKYKININENDDSFPEPIRKLIHQFNSIILPKEFEKYIEQIWKLPVYEDDIWVITYPKCGTTWTQEAVWQICNGVDIDGRGKVSLRERFPFLEIQSVAAAPDKEPTFDAYNNLPRPRFIKSHLPIAFLPKQLWEVKPKIVYVTRDSKDTAISFYHHYYNLYQYQGSKEDFLDLFLKGEVEHGNYWDHIEQFKLLTKFYSNLKIITFEDMKSNLNEIIDELCSFLEKPLSEEKKKILFDHLQFDKMKCNPAINPPHLKDVVRKNRPGSDYVFLRRGQTESFRDEMPQEYVKMFNDYDNCKN
uniref:CSON007198 protein n=1 Tax=Culicoides sonorensis TaxID=179676 RepID=A0A336MW82_CULSO